MNWTISQTVDLSRGYTPVVWPDALMVSGDVGAHTWRLTVLDNGVPADLSGATITGSFLRADGNTVLVSGTVSGNIASVTLTDVCYAVEGKMKGTIKMTKSGAVITLAAVIFMVSLFTSGSVIDPGVAYADFQIDASPKGVYANLAALNADTAADVSKIYITLDDGNWCYHNGSAFVAGGVYQAASIAEDSISPTKLRGAQVTGNLVPYAVKTVVGKMASDPISSGTLTETVNADYTYHIIKVTPGEQYTCTNGRIVVLLGPDQASVISVLTYQNTFNAATAQYVAISYNHNDYPTATYIVSEGDKLVPEEYVLVPWLQIAGPGALADSIVTWRKIDGAEPVGNLRPHALRTVVGKYAADNGGVLEEGDNVVYTYHIIDVAPNTSYSCTAGRFVVVLEDDMHTVVASLENSTAFNSGAGRYVAISYNHTTTPTEDWELRKTGDTVEGSKIQIPWLLTGESGVQSTADNRVLSGTKASMGAADSLTLGTSYDIKKRKTQSYYARVTTMGSLVIGQGITSYGGSYVVIDGTHITVYAYTTAPTQKAMQAHGLSISGFVGVTVSVKAGLADITLSTAAGDYTLADAPWDGAGPIEARVDSGSLTDCFMTWTSADLAQDLWIFGDSYISLRSADRWPEYILGKGYENWLACGYPGSGSGTQYACFQNLMQMARPEVVAWLLGMNDGDGSSVNPGWLAAVQAVLTYCEEQGITPVLATIPSTPTVNNSHKNAWVRASGHRYIDFDKAVGADISTAWYTGMLHADQVHPTALGAKALAARLLVDLPEICQ